MNYRKPAFWIILAAIAACAVLALCFLTDRTSSEEWDERPMLVIDGRQYIDPYKPESSLPNGYTLVGQLTEKEANNTGLAGTRYYTNPKGTDYYTYQLCGKTTGLTEVDSRVREWQYLRWIPADQDPLKVRSRIEQGAEGTLLNFYIGDEPRSPAECSHSDGSLATAGIECPKDMRCPRRSLIE